MSKKNISKYKVLIAFWFIQKKTLSFLTQILGKSIQATNVKNQDLEIKVNSNNIYPILYFLQKHTICRFDTLIDIVCYDTPGKALRFGVVYNLLSVYYNTRIRVVSKFKNTTSLLSALSLFSGAGWMEREILDMFGVCFFF